MNIKFALMIVSLLILAVSPAMAAEEKAAPAAVAGFSNIAVLDLEMVVQKSEAGKGVQAAIKTREDALRKEAEGYKKTLREKEQKLIADRKGGQDDKAFAEAKKGFEAELKKSQKAVLDKNLTLERSKMQALADIQKRIAEITADIADERKLQIVVDRKFVVIAEQKLDITEEVLKRLNAKVKSIPLK